MKKYLLFIWLMVFVSLGVNAQEKKQRIRLEWAANANFFFDNQEFDGLKLRTAQSDLGLHLAPEIGMTMDTIHHFRVGVDLEAGLGGHEFLKRASLIAYYKLDYAPFRCYVGSFPRRYVINYPQALIEDSINFHRPNMSGVFIEYYRQKGFINVWLDWVSLPTKTQRELFFIGFSGRYQYKMFVTDLYGYMYHKAHRFHQPHLESLHDNGMSLLSAGMDFTHKTPLDTLSLTVGWLQAYERCRDEHKWHFPVGVTADFNIRYSGLGIKNFFYYGDKQQIFYDRLGTILYWGDHLYSSNLYNRTDIYLDFVSSTYVNARLTCALHVVDGKLYNQQLFTVYVNLDQDFAHKKSKPHFFWQNWFRKTKKQTEI